MSKTRLTVMLLGLVLILAGCSTHREKINLFETSDYVMTQPGSVVAGLTTKTPGIWLSKDAVTRLQESGELAGKLK